jgi:hypothetical protein
MPHYSSGEKNARHQADLLYLPNDEGYLYLLVVVDIATRLIDAEPLKVRDSKTVRDAMKKIYNRKILKLPTFDLQVDEGTEFKAEFKKYFEKLTKIFTKQVGRSRQQAVIESKNKIIGTILNKKMLADEINNDQTSRSWVDIVPEVVKLINNEYGKTPDKFNIDDSIKTDKLNKKLIPVGSKVRVKLDTPKDYVSGDKLRGKSFRSGDIRYNKEPKTVTQVYLNPSSPPMYQVDNKDNVAYTRPQLQIIENNEVLPKTNRLVAKQIIGKKKVKGKIEYNILWQDDTTSWEKYEKIKNDLKELIKDYNDQQK